MVGGVVTGRHAIHVLSIELQAVEAPIPHGLGDDGLVVLHHRGNGGTEIPRVPIGNLLLRSVGIEQQILRVLLDQLRVRFNRQRRPPELSFETFGVNPVHHRFDVAVATGEFLRIQEPIPLGGLPSVIQRDPPEAQLFHDRQGVVDLRRSEVPAVAPGAPDGTEGVIRRRLEHHALFDHRPPILRSGFGSSRPDER